MQHRQRHAVIIPRGHDVPVGVRLLVVT
jgi:hypothetical protein